MLSSRGTKRLLHQKKRSGEREKVNNMRTVVYLYYRKPRLASNRQVVDLITRSKNKYSKKSKKS